MSTALVTGAGGFLARHVATALLDAGWSVHGLARAEGPSFTHVPDRVLPVDADLRDRRAVRSLVRGCDAVFHVAATYTLSRRRGPSVIRDDVDATASVLAACRSARVPLVHTSSVATIGQPGDGTPGDERTPLSSSQLTGAYKHAKLATELMVADAAREGLFAVVVNPTAPVGPGDWRPTPTGRVIRDAARSRLPAIVHTGLNIVAVEDVAAGHLLALEAGRSGRRYILGGDDMTLAEVVAEASRAAGRRTPGLTIPHSVAIAVSAVDEAVEGWALGREPRAPLDGALMARKTMYASSARARAELGYSPGPAAPAITAAVDWYLDTARAAAKIPAEKVAPPARGPAG